MPDPNDKSVDQNIDVNDKAACESWVHKLNVTHEQLREAIDAVGGNPTEVEMHLKGSRATTNAEKTKKAEDKPSGS